MRTRVSVTLTRLALLLLLPSMILAQQNTTGGGKKGDQGKQPQQPQRETRERDFRQSPDQQMHRMRRPVRLSGKVVLADGSPLPGSVNVELLCSGSVRQQAFTFNDGNFSFEVGSPSSMAFADASVGGAWNPGGTNNPSGQSGLDSFDGSMNLAGCELARGAAGLSIRSTPARDETATGLF